MDLAEGKWLIVAGYFDPLTATVAGRLRELVDQAREEKVLAVVLEDSEALLSAEARSLLLAALRTVHAVVAMSEKDLNGFVPRNERTRFVFDREAERKNSAEFAALVLSKERVHSGELGS
jgi:hypothetical protein